MLLKNLFLFLKLFLLIAINTPITASACLPPLDSYPASITQKSQSSTFVFSGIVTEITDNHVLVRVSQYFKGTGLNEVKITGFNIHNCSDHLILKQRALFFTTGAMGGLLVAHYDGSFGSIAELNAATLAEIATTQECMASYIDGRLKIPCVVINGSDTIYQALLTKIEPEEPLKLSLSYSKPATKIQQKALISDLKILLSPSGQVDIKVTGFFVDGCGRLGPIYTHQVDHEFIITITQYRIEGACTMATETFEKTITLGALSPGDYSVMANELKKNFSIRNGILL